MISMHVMCGFLMGVLRVIVLCSGRNIISRLKLIMSWQLSLGVAVRTRLHRYAQPPRGLLLASHNIIILYMYLSGTDEMHKIRYVQLLSANATWKCDTPFRVDNLIAGVRFFFSSRRRAWGMSQREERRLLRKSDSECGSRVLMLKMNNARNQRHFVKFAEMPVSFWLGHAAV